MRENFKKALKNIISHGDTDVFPFPFERHLFEDSLEETLDILENIHKNFDDHINISPPQTIVKASQVGYYGFRRVTLIEPFWNAYFLGLVISIAKKIEEVRLPIKDEKIFSYRFCWDKAKNTLFQDTTWLDYKRKCVELSKDYPYVLQTDISNFYPRINHHKLENELDRLNSSNTTIKILNLLSLFSGTISYGLPVGGPAARILAELSLNHADKHLKVKGIMFCRYADDYTIFCKSESEGYKTLILLSEKLANDQLSLQKGKTKILSSTEFRDIHQFLDPQEINSPDIDDEQKLLNISIRFDPYSPTAVEDYEQLKQAVQEIDIIGILSREVNKTSIDQTVTKQAINAIKVLSVEDQISAIKILLDHNNLTTLSPVFTTILRLVRSIYEDLHNSVQVLIDSSLLELFSKDNYLIKIELNLNFIIQILSIKYTDEKESLLTHLYDTEPNHLLRRQIIITMAHWNCHYWLVDVKNNFQTLSMWERRAFIYASYFLGDEGKHWREHYIKLFSPEEKLIKDWCSKRFLTNKKILV
ncbi:RNA-directed DNA polymerase [Flavobacterium subsaxonicum]|uniref:Reverse transcriptase domain-containing protein n=1 Tax=Flavobacterium subsaxonicum WB 4.1-42 = DSM 21790 TaxID=1121898 RepID=A0A0A2MTQ1_9FLAO|nr:RNA-directed DNA polymerase [Flavobacterium subsaxonicum]KGO94843.1 hypothetical protein Q766_01630 [Flavobacterium subsaxonicum WB 4.1-42 = DSM 21790]